MDKLLSKLPEKDEFYYFGAAGFNIESRFTFDEAQMGYRAHPNGEDLTGNNDGDWLPAWYYIGRDTLVGDPFFVDTNSESLPVYTAMHGQGGWDPELVSESLAGFLTSLKYLKEKSKQEVDLIEPDENTISGDNELEDIHKHVLSLCGENSSFFWECFIEQHQDWILESED